jgi:hypothetical protein
MSVELPPLPPGCTDPIDVYYGDVYDCDKMLAYGEACYRKAIDEAAHVLEDDLGLTRDGCIINIRALIGEKK